MTQTILVQIVCPDCRRQFDVPDGAPEAECPQCHEALVWRSCLDTNEVFTVLKKWETWVHPGCETKHPVDLTHVLSAARPQGLDPAVMAASRHGAPDQGEVGGEQTVYSPVQLASDVEWADQAITGRLIVDSDRLAILPGPGVPRPPLSVAWLRDVQDYTVQPASTEVPDQKRKRFGRRKDENDVAQRPSLLVLSVPGGQISITATEQPEVLLGQLDQLLRPRMNVEVDPAPQAAHASPPAKPEHAAPPAAEESAGLETGGPVRHGAMPTPPSATTRPEPPSMPDMEPDTPEGVYESIRKLAELAVLGTISSEDFATKKAQLLARL